MEDEKIIDLSLARDESAIRETAAKYGTRLKAIAYAILESRESAEECENDAYLEAWRRIPPTTAGCVESFAFGGGTFSMMAR